MKKVKNLNLEELIELVNMVKLLGYSGFLESMDMFIKIRGYRIFSKIYRLLIVIIENLVNYFENF